MLTTTTPTRSTAVSRPRSAAAPHVSAIDVALDDARARLEAALADLRELVSRDALSSADAFALEAEYVERCLQRIAELEERGALACTPEQWQQFTVTAARRRAARRGASTRRDRARDTFTDRQCRVLVPGRVRDPFAALIDPEHDAELLEIRAELAAAQLL